MLAHYIKRGAHNTFFYGLSSAINRAISFLFFPYFLSMLTLTEFGIWDFYQTFFSLGTTALIACASASLIRFYFLYKDEPFKLKQAIGNACLMVLLSMIFLAGFLGCLLYFSIITIQHRYIFLTFINICLFSFFALTTAFLRIKEQLTTYLLLFTSQSILATAFMVYGIKNGFGIDSFFYANLISLSLFSPFFIIFFGSQVAFSSQLFKEQLRFSVPLLLYSIIYTGFFSIDRFFIKTYGGYEMLGVYSLLWRFGVLYQFFSLALIDAWPIVSYNADKEVNREHILSRLVSYYVMILVFLGLSSLVGSHCLIEWFIPATYHTLLIYFPLFFLMLVILDTARIFQSSFCISINTHYIPLLTFLILLFQSSLFLMSSYFFQLNIWMILLINSMAFTLFSGINFYYGNNVFKNIFNLKHIMRVLISGCCYFAIFQLIFLYAKPWYYSVLILCSWPIIVVLFFLDDEKEWFFKNWYTNMSNNTNTVSLEYEYHRYSEGIFNKKIALFGPYPPPLGGISVHIQRVKNKFLKQQNSVYIFDTMNCCTIKLIHAIRIIIFLLVRRPHLIYYHTAYSWLGLYELIPVVLGAYIIKSNLLLVEHDCRYLASRSYQFKAIFAFLMRYVYQQIFIGNVTVEQYKEQGMVIQDSAVIETPFLPPDTGEEEVVKRYPVTLEDFLNSHTPLISANAFQIVLLNNTDLYGIEWCIDLTAELKKTFPTIGFIIFLSQVGNESYFSYLVKKINDLNLKNSMYLLQGQYEYWPLLKRVDLFVSSMVF